jgi:hypothetical protein
MLEMLNKFRRSAVFFRSTCDMYTSGHEIAMRRFEIDVNIISSYRTDMQVLPCGAIGVLLSLQYKALNKHRGRSHIVYSRRFVCNSRLALFSRNKDTTLPFNCQRARRVGVAGPFSRHCVVIVASSSVYSISDTAHYTACVPSSRHALTGTSSYGHSAPVGRV